MDHPSFRDQLDHVNSPSFYASTGFVDQIDLNDFFSGDKETWSRFISDITGKRVMEIGPCLLTKIAYWDVASERIAIELYTKKYRSIRIKTLVRMVFLV
jgi:hypothetical protein